MNTDKLKGVIREKKETYSSCAKATNMSTTSFNSKMNGKSSFDIIEINKLISFLELPKNEASDIFL